MSGGRRAVIVGSGANPAPEELRAMVHPDDYLVAADGGADALDAAGMAPDAVIGDMDSISPRLRETLEDGDGSIHFITHPAKKDSTDAQLALEHVLGELPDGGEIALLGVFGNRVDHALGTVLLLAGLPAAVRRRVVLTDGAQFARTVEGTLELRGSPGDLVSLLPLTPRVEGVFLEGFSFPLCDGELRWGNTLGVSNHLAGPRGLIRVEGEGTLLAVHTPS